MILSEAKNHRFVKKVLFLLLFFSSLHSFGQNFRVDYNTVIDFDGIKKREYSESGTISFTDSLLTDEYKGGSLVFKVYKTSSNKVYYYNDYGESVKVTFTSNSIVTKINETRPSEYTIYRRK